MSATNPLCILRLPSVIDRVGFGRGTIYSRLKAGRFPKQIKLGNTPDSHVAWSSRDIDDFVAALCEGREWADVLADRAKAKEAV